MKYFFFIVLLIVFQISCIDSEQQDKKTLKISAAASLIDVLDELTKKFEEEETIKGELNFASSSIIARQIANGLETDLYISANPDWVEYLVRGQFVENEGTQELFSNSLIVVTPLESHLKLSSVYDLVQSRFQTVAIGDPSHVPAGLYAKETLKNAGIWGAVKSKLVGTIDVRAALAFVQNGSADCAIVYSSDIYNKNDIKIALIIPEVLMPEIKYVAGIIKNGDKVLAERFVAFLQDSAQQSIIKKYGFKPI